MGALVARLWRSGERLDTKRIQHLWSSYIERNTDFFEKVLNNVVARDTGIAEILLSRKHASNPDEQKYVLSVLGDNFIEFFEQLVQDDKLNDLAELKRVCFVLGMQHAAFTTERFSMTYWDVFTLAMIEELEIGGVQPRDLRAWQALMHQVVKAMDEGYEHGQHTQQRSQFD
uniref:Globin family profile domain-containing protein n=1 Tax=Plectus sambesii TaxID=2011161 RepID=A0A914WEM7_9BILA